MVVNNVVVDVDVVVVGGGSLVNEGKRGRKRETGEGKMERREKKQGGGGRRYV